MEIIKYGGSKFQEKMPEAWHEGMIITIYEKSDQKKYKNVFRGITILNNAYKIPSTLIQITLKK